MNNLESEDQSDLQNFRLDDIYWSIKRKIFVMDHCAWLHFD